MAYHVAVVKCGSTKSFMDEWGYSQTWGRIECSAGEEGCNECQFWDLLGCIYPGTTGDCCVSDALGPGRWVLRPARDADDESWHLWALHDRESGTARVATGEPDLMPIIEAWRDHCSGHGAKVLTIWKEEEQPDRCRRENCWASTCEDRWPEFKQMGRLWVERRWGREQITRVTHGLCGEIPIVAMATLLGTARSTVSRLLFPPSPKPRAVHLDKDGVEMLDTAEAAGYLGIAKETLRISSRSEHSHWSGHVPRHVVNKRGDCYFSIADLDARIERMKESWSGISESEMSESDAAVLLAISRNTLAGYRSDGVGPRYRVAGKRIAYRAKDVLRWANEREAKGALANERTAE